MSTFKKQIKTKKSKAELRQVIDKLLLDMPVLKSVVSRVEWQGDKLLFDSKLGNGNFIIYDNLVEFEIMLNIAGKMAVHQLEKYIDDGFEKLDGNV